MSSPEDDKPKGTLERKPTWSALKGSNKTVLSIIGDAFCDVMCSGVANMPRWGEDELVDSPIELLPGGSAANCASWVASLSYSEGNPDEDAVRVVPRLFTRIGSDVFGQCLQSHARASLVILASSSYVLDESTGTCVVISGKKDRGFVTHRGAVGRLEKFQIF